MKLRTFCSFANSLILPGFMFSLGSLGIFKNGISATVELMVILAISAFVNNLALNSWALSVKKVSRGMLPSLSALLVVQCLLASLYILELNIHRSALIGLVGVSYGLASCIFQLHSRLSFKFMSDAIFIFFFFKSLLLIGALLFSSITFNLSIGTTFILASISLTTLGSAGLFFSKVLNDDEHETSEPLNFKIKNFAAGFLMSFRINGIILLPYFLGEQENLSVITFALFLMRPLSLIFTVASPLIYKLIDENKLSGNMSGIFLKISVVYSIIATGGGLEFMQSSGETASLIYVFSILILFFQVNLGFFRNIFEYKYIQADDVDPLILSASVGIFFLLLSLTTLAYFEKLQFLIVGLLISELAYCGGIMNSNSSKNNKINT